MLGSCSAACRQPRFGRYERRRESWSFATFTRTRSNNLRTVHRPVPLIDPTLKYRVVPPAAAGGCWSAGSSCVGEDPRYLGTAWTNSHAAGLDPLRVKPGRPRGSARHRVFARLSLVGCLLADRRRAGKTLTATETALIVQTWRRIGPANLPTRPL